MPAIVTSIDISASPARVWAILIAFDDYPNWNPFVISIAGTPREGMKLRVRIKPPGQSGMTFKPTVVTASVERQLTWLGHLLVPGMFDGRHELRIEPQGEHCRFHQSEQFSGILVPLFGRRLLDATKRGFEEMNAALKKKAENQANI